MEKEKVVCRFIYELSLIGYCLWLGWFMIFSSSNDELLSYFRSIKFGFFYFLIFMIGMIFFSRIYLFTMEKIFYSESESELEVSKLEKKYKERKHNFLKRERAKRAKEILDIKYKHKQENLKR